MSIQYVNVGNVVNDGTGDDLYSAFVKINENFQQLDFIHAQNNTASNIGTGIGIYKEKIGVDLRFKSLVAGAGISLADYGSSIVLSNNNQSIKTIVGDTGSYSAISLTSAVNIKGSGNVRVIVVGNTVTIQDNYSLSTETSPSLSANLNLNNKSLLNGATITANNFIGTLTGNVTGNIVGNLLGLVNGFNIETFNDRISNFDFGRFATVNISPDVDFLTWFKSNLYVDLGTFTSPATTFNLGSVNDGGAV
jgi:hypothetical protein